MRVMLALGTTISIIICGCRQQINNNTDSIVDKRQAVTYKIIPKTYLAEPEEDPITKEVYSANLPGAIDTTAILRLNEPLKAVAAFYAAIGGTGCFNDTTCELTTALGLGRQGSDLHKSLIRKYFPNDKLAEAVILQDCYTGKSGSSAFSEYEYLTLTDLKDTVKVDYNLCYDAHGNIGSTKGTDTYLFKDNKFSKVERNIWPESDK